jgi:hypothetical protein
MQSSTARALSGLHNNNLAVDVSEVEPLLEGANELDTSDFEIIVDRKPTLAETLSELDRGLAQAEKGADKKVNRRVGKYYLYVTLFVTLLTTLAVAPQVGLNFLFRYLSGLSKQMEDSAREALNGWIKERDHLQKELDEDLARLEPDLVKRDAILMPQYKKWWQYDNEDSNCDFLHDAHRAEHESALSGIFENKIHPKNNKFCIEDASFQAIPSKAVLQKCIEIAREGCEIEHEHDLLLSLINDQRDYINSMTSFVDNAQQNIDYNRQVLDYRHWRDSVFDIGMYAGLGVVAGGLVLGLAYYVIQRARENWPAYQGEKVNLRSAANNLTPEQFQMVNDLPVSVHFNALMSITALRQEVADRIEEAELRARQRAAFLSAKKYPESALHRFFQIANHRDLAKDIFLQAGLSLPKP